MTMSFDNIALGASILFALVAALVAAKGAVRTQLALQHIGAHDALIDAMAWIDRNILALHLLRRDVRHVGAQVRDYGDRVERKVDFYGKHNAQQLDEIKAQLQLLRNDPRGAATAAEYH